MKLIDVVNFHQFYNTIKSQKLPFSVAYRLAKIVKASELEVELYFENFRSILDTYAEKDENGQLRPTDDGAGVKLRPGVEYQCALEFKQLQEAEVEIPSISFAPEDFDGVEISAEHLLALMPFFK